MSINKRRSHRNPKKHRKYRHGTIYDMLNELNSIAMATKAADKKKKKELRKGIAYPPSAEGDKPDPETICPKEY